MGPRKARLELSKRNALPLMTDLLFVVTGMVWQGGLSTDDILGLIRLGGGKVVSTVPQDRTTHYVHIVGDDQDLAATIVRKTHHEVRDFFWLMDGISAYVIFFIKKKKYQKSNLFILVWLAMISALCQPTTSTSPRSTTRSRTATRTTMACPRRPFRPRPGDEAGDCNMS